MDRRSGSGSLPTVARLQPQENKPRKRSGSHIGFTRARAETVSDVSRPTLIRQRSGSVLRPNQVGNQSESPGFITPTRHRSDSLPRASLTRQRSESGLHHPKGPRIHTEHSEILNSLREDIEDPAVMKQLVKRMVGEYASEHEMVTELYARRERCDQLRRRIDRTSARVATAGKRKVALGGQKMFLERELEAARAQTEAAYSRKQAVKDEIADLVQTLTTEAGALRDKEIRRKVETMKRYEVLVAQERHLGETLRCNAICLNHLCEGLGVSPAFEIVPRRHGRQNSI